MADATTWGIISAAFTPAGGSVVNITDCTDVSFDDDITLQELLTDNNTNINLIFGTGGKTSFTIKSTDTSIAWVSTITPGTAGALVLVFGKRKAGKGYVSGGNKTLTASNSVLGKRTGSAASGPAGSSDFNFTAYDNAGVIFSVA